MITVRKNILLAPYTTFQIGGPVEYFTEAGSKDDITEAIKWANTYDKNFLVLGKGSNVLISDSGYSGLVIFLTHQDYCIENEKISCFAGCVLSDIIEQTIKGGLCGMEKLAGIPGTLGGAIRGNAGAFGVEIKDIVESVSCVSIKDREIISRIFSHDECGFGYRSSYFKENPYWIIVGATLALKKGDRELAYNVARDTVRKRNKKQNQKVFSAGSFFKNPTTKNDVLIKEFEKDIGGLCKNNTIPAGWLIAKAGLHSSRIGSAIISPEHANYIVNKDNATSFDVIALVNLIKDGVKEKYGVLLEEEVHIIG